MMPDPFPVLVIDTETGGLSPREHSLLTIAGVAWTPSAQPRPLFSLMVREEPMIVQPEAMEVNRIDLRVIEEQGLTPAEAVDAIRYALDHHFGPNREPVCLAGHNIGFDVGFLQRLYRLGKAEYAQDFARRTLDTATIFAFFMASGLVPPGKANGDRMFASMGIPVGQQHRHTALGDAWATALSLSRMAQTLRRGRLPEVPQPVHN
jgi:DNA polymerase III epsilon subunit-like protein